MREIIQDGLEEGDNIMDISINLKKVIKWEEYIESIEVEKEEVEEMMYEAREFLNFYTWVDKIIGAYVGILYVGIVGVFLFKIKSTRKGISSWVWVIVGDLPPAYITIDDCPNPATALDGYIGAMLDWVDAAKEGSLVNNLIPVNIPATEENATRLKTRLDFLDEHILNNHEDDLKQ